jgi:hypothetical protein
VGVSLLHQNHRFTHIYKHAVKRLYHLQTLILVLKCLSVGSLGGERAAHTCTAIVFDGLFIASSVWNLNLKESKFKIRTGAFVCPSQFRMFIAVGLKSYSKRVHDDVVYMAFFTPSRSMFS